MGTNYLQQECCKVYIFEMNESQYFVRKYDLKPTNV